MPIYALQAGAGVYCFFGATGFAAGAGAGSLLNIAVMTRSMTRMKNRSLNPARKARMYKSSLPLGAG